MNCLHLFRATSKLEYHRKVYENKDFYTVLESSADTKILESNQYQESDKTESIIYADIKSLIKK